MPNKVLDSDYIRNLLAGDKKKPPKSDAKTAKAQFALTYKPDPLHSPQAGYEQKGDRGDIWVQWVRQGRTGAAELIERWSA